MTSAFVHVQDQVALPPLCGPGCVVSAEVHLCSVFRQAVAGGGPGDAVTCHQSEQQRAEDTTMSCAEGDDIGGVVSSRTDWSVRTRC